MPKVAVKLDVKPRLQRPILWFILKWWIVLIKRDKESMLWAFKKCWSISAKPSR